MVRCINSRMFILGVVASSFFGGQALAQVPQPAPVQPAPQPAEAEPEETVSAPASTESAPPSEYQPAESNSNSDHAKVIGHFGIGFFGIRSLPTTFATDATTMTTKEESIEAPTIGARLWLNETVGLEAAIGFASKSGSVSIDGPMSSNANQPTRYGFAFHGAVPLALYHQQHYKFLVIPEINLGFGGGTNYGASSREDVIYHSFLFEVGARVGAEVHFGFIGVPQLSLQGTVGAQVHYQNISQSVVSGTDEIITSVSGVALNTSVQNEPWNIFIANVAAIYYF